MTQPFFDPKKIVLGTYRGTYFDLGDPTLEQVDLATIAHALARLNRFTGHLEIPYSVAMHAIAVSDRLFADTKNPLIALQGLHHDSHEAYLGDVTTPVKKLIFEKTGMKWDVIEADVRDAVRVALGVPCTLHGDVIKMDLNMTCSEHYHFGHADLRAWYGGAKIYPLKWPDADPTIWTRRFLERDRALRLEAKL